MSQADIEALLKRKIGLDTQAVGSRMIARVINQLKILLILFRAIY